MICPSCGCNNIEGIDSCENCMEPLRDIDVPRASATSGLVHSIMEDDLRRLEHKEFLTAKGGESAIDVVRRMKKANANCALVFGDGGNLEGVFTAQDALRKMGIDPAASSFSINDVMTPKPEALRETDSIATAFNKMSVGGFRHVPVLCEDGSYSIVSVDHLLNYIAEKDW